MMKFELWHSHFGFQVHQLVDLIYKKRMALIGEKFLYCAFFPFGSQNTKKSRTQVDQVDYHPLTLNLRTRAFRLSTVQNLSSMCSFLELGSLMDRGC
ncbi:unnamed protein product [Ilex paraguariensis]|uniref:Uncharacterized protein n=1 Tax=Ilex paraguariensis TaxID=185542 RepID=A0ABC8R2A5_9AQUA